MSIVATTNDGGMAYPQVSSGVHKARCIRVIDLGTQRQEYSGEVSWKRQVMLIWEVPEQDNMNGEPLTISKFYTLSLHEKSNLGADLSSWRGRAFTETEKQGFDISKMLVFVRFSDVLGDFRFSKNFEPPAPLAPPVYLAIES